MSNLSDNFNRANSTSTINPPSDGGVSWTTSNTWGVLSSRAYNPSVDSRAVVLRDSGTSDVDVQATLYPGNDMGVVARAADAADTDELLFRGRPGNGYDLYKAVSNSFTLLAGGLGTVTSGDVVKLSCNGTTLKGVVNGVTLTTQTDGAGLTNTKHGLRFSSESTGTADDWSSSDPGGGGGGGIVYTQLEREVRGLTRGVYTGG